jgi:hypothetical protein
LQPKVTSSGGSFDLAALTDGDLVKATTLPAAPVGQKAWIQLEFARPQAVQGLALVAGGGRGGRGGGVAPAIEVGDDGQQFREVATIPTGGGPQHTIAFPPVTARFFRIAFTTAQPPAAGRGGAPAGYQIAELVLYSGARVHRFEEKAAFAAVNDLSDWGTPAVAAQDAVRKADVLDLTARMKPDGTLDWTPPAGRWVVLRQGVFRKLPRPVQRHRGRPDGQARPALRDHR